MPILGSFGSMNDFHFFQQQKEVFTWSDNILEVDGTTTGTSSTGDPWCSHISNVWRRMTVNFNYSNSELYDVLNFNDNGAEIAGIRFYVYQQPNYQPYPYYGVGLKHTLVDIDETSCGATFTEVSNYASQSFTTGEVKTILFDTNFEYNIAYNLAFSFAWGQCPTNYSTSGRVYRKNSGATFYNGSDNTGRCYINDITDNNGNSVSYDYRPVLQLLYKPISLDAVLIKKYFFIYSSGIWQVPPDWNINDNKIIAIGAGGGGGSSSAADSSGGGGGAYAEVSDITLVKNSSVYVHVGAGGISENEENGGDGGDTWLNKSVNNAPSSTDDGVLAVGGDGGLSDGVNYGTENNGASAAYCIGDIKKSGGDGYGDNGNYNSGGGGGAGGPDADGDDGDGNDGGDGNGGEIGGGAGGTDNGEDGGEGSLWDDDGEDIGPGGGGAGNVTTDQDGGNGGNYGGAGGGGTADDGDGGYGADGVIIIINNESI